MIQTVLHVDDDYASLKAVQRSLRKEPYQIISVNNSRKALEIAKNIQFDLAILDVSMPDRNGFKLLTRLRELDSNLPVLMLTGLVEEFVFYQTVLLNCNCYLEKPYNSDDLKEEIRKILLQKNQLTNQYIS